MPHKTLLIFCDATGQDGVYAGSDPNLQSGATTQYPSNVLRLSRAVAPKRGDVLQITFYQSGVGSLADFAGESTIEDKKIALYGTAVASKIRDAYAFIAQNYEDGNDICLFGFSRGAYTVRKVAGLINRIGLLGRKEFSKFFQYWQDLLDPKTQDNPPWPAKPIPIKCVGVFDTVGSVYSGVIPHPILDALSIKDTSLPPNVEVALHAVSLHENRKPFMCTLWTEPEGGLAKGQVLKQRYFPGAHSDVGGGFPNHELADVALFWMGAEISEFIELDLPFLAAWRQPKPEAPWGGYQPHNMWQENGSVPWMSATRLEGDQITRDTEFHPSVRVIPKELENPKNMITMEDLINKFGEGWYPIYAELLPFEKECAANWNHQIPQQDVHGPKTAGGFIHELATSKSEDLSSGSVDHRKQSYVKSYMLQNHALGKGEDEDYSFSLPERGNYSHLVSPSGEHFEVTTMVPLGTSKSEPLSTSEDPSSGNVDRSKQSYQLGKKCDLRIGEDEDYPASPPENYLQNISHLVSPSGERFEVTIPVPLGRYSFAKVPTSGSEELVEQLEDIPLCVYLLVIGNKKYAALIDDNLQCRWLKSLSELRCFMQAHNVVRRDHLEAGPVETYATGAKNDETWYCRYLVGGKWFLGVGLTKQQAKDEAGLRMLLAHQVDIRQLG